MDFFRPAHRLFRSPDHSSDRQSREHSRLSRIKRRNQRQHRRNRPTLELLEDRTLLTTLSVELDAANRLVMTDVDPAGVNNQLSISSDGTNLIVSDATESFSIVGSVPGATLSADGRTFAVPHSSLAGSQLIVNASGGDDRVAIDFAGGNPIPGGGLVVNGGDGGDDAIEISSAGLDATYAPSEMFGDGTIEIGGSMIQFTGQEPVDFTGPGTFTLTLPGANDLVTLANGTQSGGQAATAISGSSGGVAFETARVRNAAVVINTNTGPDGNDTVTLSSGNNSHGNTSLTINTGSGTDTVSVNGAASFVGPISISTATANLNAGSSLTVPTGSNVTLSANIISIASTATISAASGTVTLRPLAVNRPIILGGTDNSLQLGLTDTELDRIIALRIIVGGPTAGNVLFSNEITMASATYLEVVSGGTINDTGTNVTFGGFPSFFTDVGLGLTAAVGIGTTSPFNTEVSFLEAATTTGGINVSDFNGTTIGGVNSSLNGVDVTGATGAVTLIASGTFTVSEGISGPANISLTTPTFATSAGVVVSANPGISTTTSSGSVSINTLALTVGPSATITTGGGKITLAAGNVSIDSTATLGAGAGTVTVKPYIGGKAIDVGGPDQPVAVVGGQITFVLGLTDAELDRVTAGTIEIGAPSSGPIAISASITPSAATNLFVQSGSSIDFGAAGSLDVAGDVDLSSGGSITTPAGSSGTTDVTADTLFVSGTLAPGGAPGEFVVNADLFFESPVYEVELGGPTPGVDYDQIDVTGTVTLDGELSVRFLKAAFVADSFTIIDNDGTDPVSGTFAGFPEGAAIFAGGFELQVTYAGGTGNDVVLTVVDAPIIVANTNNSGPLSLRQAIMDANSTPGADVIAFYISGPGSHLITPISPLPEITEAVTIDGWTEPDYAGSPVIELDGALAGPLAVGLKVLATSTIRGLAITAFEGNGVVISDSAASGTVFENNYVGLSADGNTARGNLGHGVVVEQGATGVLIGGSAAGAGNVISGQTGTLAAGVLIVGEDTSGNKVQGNRIGTNAAGDTALGNQIGVWFYSDASANFAGTDGDGVGDATEGNLISGNTGTGVYLQSNADNNVIAGNLIGTSLTGDYSIPNDTGIRIFEDHSSNGTRIGTNADGTSDDLERNVISGNTNVNVFIAGANGTVVAGNYIGTNGTGDFEVGNTTYGVVISNGSFGTRVGTNADGINDDEERNVIAGYSGYGISIGNPGTTANTVAGNYMRRATRQSAPASTASTTPAARR